MILCDAHRVTGFQRVRDLPSDSDGFLDRDWTLLDARVQALVLRPVLGRGHQIRTRNAREVRVVQ